MNKKIDEQFEGIFDRYVLQCICTQMKERIEELEENNKLYQEELLRLWKKLKWVDDDE